VIGQRTFELCYDFLLNWRTEIYTCNRGTHDIT